MQDFQLLTVGVCHLNTLSVTLSSWACRVLPHIYVTTLFINLFTLRGV